MNDALDYLEGLPERVRGRSQLGIGADAEQGDGPDADGGDECDQKDVLDERGAVILPPEGVTESGDGEVR